MLRKLNLLSPAPTTFLPTLLALVVALGCSDCLAREQAMTFRIYFGQDEPAQVDQDCGRVVAVARTAPKTPAVAEAALKALFQGPTPEERRQGYHSWFSEETRFILKRVKVSRGTAYVDLHDIRELLPGATSSCGGTEFFAQVEATLKQFPTIKKVVFAIEGKPRTFYEWMQQGCGKSNNYCNDQPFRSYPRQ